MFRNKSDWLSDRLHFLFESHLNSRRYHFVFLTLTFPPVFCTARENRSRSDWDGITVYVVVVVGDGAIWMMVGFLTKQYPNIFRELWDI